MDVNVLLKEKRESLGLTDTEVCTRTGISIDEHWDLEAYPAEFFDCLSWGNAKKLCEVLKIDIREIIHENIGYKFGLNLDTGRSDILVRGRLALGKSKEQVADEIGYEAVVIERAENDADSLDTLSVSTVLNIAKSLKIDPALLL